MSRHDTPLDHGHDLLLRYEKSLDCVHCGLCLSDCPTYEVTGDEALSPRGRIHLMRGRAEGRFELTDDFRQKIDTCLGCRACESVCPSGVQYGRMLEITREEMFRKERIRPMATPFRNLLLRRVLPHPQRLERFVAATALAQNIGAFAVLRFLGRIRLLPKRLRVMMENLPEIPEAERRRPMKRRVEPAGEARGQAFFFEGCVMRPLFGAVNAASLNALTERDYAVRTPDSQGCCGALHAHQGDMDTARSLARRNIEAFRGEDPVVVNASGCGAAMKDYPHWFPGDESMTARAVEFADRVMDLTTLCARDIEEGYDLPSAPWIDRPTRAVYDAPCHLHHAQGIHEDPRRLLERREDLEILPLEGSEDCCGAAGIYNLMHDDLADQILERKLDQLEASRAELLITANPGCQLQWEKGIRRRGLDVVVKHIAELL